MIQRLHLGNFKAFAETQQPPLRPLTLLYGPNSASKSSLVHSLALAHHGLLTGDLDVQRTEVGGESIDLGGFRQYVHRRDANRRVERGMDVTSSAPTGWVDVPRPASPLANAAGAVGAFRRAAGSSAAPLPLYPSVTPILLDD